MKISAETSEIGQLLPAGSVDRMNWHGIDVNSLNELALAMYSAQVAPIDARGLMPVEVARATLPDVRRFAPYE